MNQKLGQVECFTTLLNYSELKSPSCAELLNFVNFLNEQIDVLENSSVLRDVTSLRGICA